MDNKPTTLVIDPDSNWLEHCAGQGATVCFTVDKALGILKNSRFERIIISSYLMDHIPALAAYGRVEVATLTPGASESAEAYKAGACDYWTKDLGKKL